MQKRFYTILLIILNLLYILSGAISWPFQLSFILSYIALSVFFLKGRISLFKLSMLFIPAFLLHNTVGLFHPSLMLFPLLIMPPLVFTIMHLLVRRTSKFLSIFCILLCTWPSYKGMQKWLYQYKNHFFLETFNTPFPEVKIINTSNNTYTFTTSKDTLYVLDCYTTRCGLCFRAFPKFKNLAKQYSSSKKIVFATLNIPVRNDTLEKTKKLISTYFDNNLFCLDTNWPYNLMIEAVPTYILVKNNRILYRGFASLDSLRFSKDLPELINKYSD